MDTQKKILIADDETITLDFFEVMLSKLGFLTEKCENGHEVLEKVKVFLPDLIILDNIMPGISGREVAKVLKNDPNYKNISIIMLSALNDVKDKIAAFDPGVDDYITKPFNFTEVLARINVVLRNRVLFDLIKIIEARFDTTIELNRDLKTNLSNFTDSIDDLNKAISVICDTDCNKETIINNLKPINEKINLIRKTITALDVRIEKIINEWDNQKKDEAGLPVLESQIRKFLHQE
jgi:CheY-like chemotaxis protein